jgi:hypothetical protein
MEPLDDSLLKSEIDAIMEKVSGVMKRLKEKGLAGGEQDGSNSDRVMEPSGGGREESPKS